MRLPVLHGVLALSGILPRSAIAQTDYYNTDRGRPFRVEDAYPLERRAFEIQAAPLRLERGPGGIYRWNIEPEIAFGVLPRTHVEVGMPLSFVDAEGVDESVVQGFEVSVLHNLNVETALPALAIAAGASLPLAPHDPAVWLKGIATRTVAWARFHVNGEYTFADESAEPSNDVARWTAGIAIDRTFPLRSLLIGAELLVQQPLASAEAPVFTAGSGLRYQLTPRWAIDAGAGKRLTGGEGAWYVTFGSAYAFGLTASPRRAR